MKEIFLSGNKKSLSFLMLTWCVLSVCGQAAITTTGQVTDKTNTLQWDWVTYTPDTTSDIYIATTANSAGSITMSGNDTPLQYGLNLSIGRGNYSTASFTLQNGAAITQQNEEHYINVAYGDYSEGTMILTDPNTYLQLGRHIYVGTRNSSDGLLQITNGAVFESRIQYVGYYGGSHGKIIVDGPHSQMKTWTSADTMIGYKGTGEIIIQNGGYVYTSWFAAIAYDSGSQGTAEVTGAGSLWTSTNTFMVGNLGTSATLKMARGGKVTANLMNVGSSADHDGTLDFIFGDTGNDTIDCGWIDAENMRLKSANLEIHVDPNVNLVVGTQYTLVDYETLGSGDLYKQFIGIDDGAIYISPEGYHFQIDYGTDLGNGDLAITATVVQVPCVVDEADLIRLLSHWLEADCAAPDWCGGADLDADTTVDLADFDQLALYWLDACPAGWPWP